MPSPLNNPPHQILVTGGAGFIGSHLVERLLADGKSVVVIDDCSTGTLDNLRHVQGHSALRVIESKISACADLGELVARSEAIFHLAAAVGVELVLNAPVRALQTNLHETEILLEAASRHQTPLVLASTSEVYGKSQKEAFSEDDDLLIGPPQFARWSYACSKLMDEFLALAYAREMGLPVIIARLFNTVGPRQTGRYGMVLPRFIAAAKSGQPLRVYGDGKQTRCFCYVADTVEALVRLQRTGPRTSCPLITPEYDEMHEQLAPSGYRENKAGETPARPDLSGEIFNVGSTEEISIQALAQKVIQTLGSTSAIELVPYEKAYAPGFEDMRRRRPVIDKLEKAVGFRPSTGLDRIIHLTAGDL